MMRRHRCQAFTLVEVLIVVVIMAVLAATIIPTFSDSTNEAKVSSAKTNIGTLRAVLALYKSGHGAFPPNNGTVSLEVSLTQRSDRDHTINASSGVYGPYLQEFPVDPFTGTVKSVTNSSDQPIAAVPAGTTTGGYNYNPSTGEIRYNYNTTQLPASTY